MAINNMNLKLFIILSIGTKLLMAERCYCGLTEVNDNRTERVGNYKYDTIVRLNPGRGEKILHGRESGYYHDGDLFNGDEKCYAIKVNCNDREIGILEAMRDLHCENIVKLYLSSSNQCVLELGTVDLDHMGYAKDHRTTCSHILKELKAGLAKLHEYDYLHGDIHTGNFMLFGNDAKLIDLGQAHSIERFTAQVKNEMKKEEMDKLTSQVNQVCKDSRNSP